MNATCELGIKNRQILKCGTAECSCVEQKREGVHSVGREREKEHTSSENRLEEKGWRHCKGLSLQKN